MIHLEKINRIFQVGDQQVRALNDVDLTIRSGEYLSIMGPSGSGKSTLLNILGLLDQPSSGTYQLDGRETTQIDDEQLARLRGRKIGFVFQFFHLIGRLSAAENIELPLILAEEAPAVRKPKVQEILHKVGLEDRAEHRPDQLSGGQRQRVAIARATITRPDVLLADEPTGNLDSVSGAEVIQLMETMNDSGLTVLVVTHDPIIGDRARRKIKMIDGAIVADTQERGDEDT
ncbi:MAG: ABC transporter ATP-binding protein [Gammaproteobacteria bacterium]|nr:ABC transporter ATP-binding protein [Gammaproteobacteria bacterium]MCZ6715444.1 ABC transporter ATP-binding protein [Gammaproteobacteria bacterium]